MRFTFSTVLLLATSLTNAAPTWPKPAPPSNVPSLTKLAKMMPKSALPTPNGLNLKYVALGIGTQNYTCLTGDENAVPGTTGAVAKLYDIGTPLSSDPMASWKLGSISGLALSLASDPRRLEQNLKSQGFEKILGDHFFTAAMPTFSLNKVRLTPFPLAFVGKKDETDAPPKSCPGSGGEPAIKWLYLVDDQNMSQGGINTIYRLQTAGGSKPATCKGQKQTWEVPYAAQYWVYGP